MNIQNFIDAITELRDAERALDWAKPKGTAQYRLQRAITAAVYLLDDVAPLAGDAKALAVVDGLYRHALTVILHERAAKAAKADEADT